MKCLAFVVVAMVCGASWLNVARAAESFFEQQVAPILSRRCFSCHNERDKKGDFSLETAAAALDSGYIEPGDPTSSTLLEVITPNKLGRAKMPKDADPLSVSERELLRRWVAAGAAWPKGFRLKPPVVTDAEWWSLRPLRRPPIPPPGSDGVHGDDWARTPIDRFIAAKHRELGLSSAPVADRRTLIRRLYYNLLGLPPPPEEVEQFAGDPDPAAYEKLVDRLLASPHYGERWARHWLDVVHYGDTHGYDKDKLRPNAWPYRDYVIRALNSDTPYGRFIKEQLAGDVLYPEEPRLIAATGFIVAGPWDFVGHVETPASKRDGRVARNLDRDDMVVNTIQTFCSVTVGCARCHNHKFDPITQEDYYSLQAVFAAVGRNDRPLPSDPRRRQLLARRAMLSEQVAALEKQIRDRVGGATARIDADIESLKGQLTQITKQAPRSPRYGYHSRVASSPEATKWVQVDLGRPLAIERVVLIGADEYGWADFGFPHRFKVEASASPTFDRATRLADHTAADFARPGPAPVEIQAQGITARYVRITATGLWSRRRAGQAKTNDWIFAIGELEVFSSGKNVARGAKVTSLDSIEAPPRWSRANLTDGVRGRRSLSPAELKQQRSLGEQIAELSRQRTEVISRLVLESLPARLAAARDDLADCEREIAALGPPPMVFAAATQFKPQGGHRPSGGNPAPIYVLKRGQVDAHGKLVGPGALRIPGGPPGRFELPADHTEGQRRAALAEWIADPRNPLTWRSIVNRVWRYHFGRGLCASPNDFGRMGARPTHPELIDWLAVEFRDGGRWITRPQSLKQLHRLIVTSAVYRQATGHDPRQAKIDGDNRYLWRQNRRRLEAEAIRDSVLLVADKLDRRMYGPGFRDFVLEQPNHSPQFVYEKHNVDDPRSHRRSVYRFLPRSQPQPFMQTLDCADPSQQVARRDETITALSALALLNNKFMVRMAEHFAARLERERATLDRQIERAYELALGRRPSHAEQQALVEFGREHGLAAACRVILNLNEFVFVD